MDPRRTVHAIDPDGGNVQVCEEACGIVLTCTCSGRPHDDYMKALPQRNAHRFGLPCTAHAIHLHEKYSQLEACHRRTGLER